jgi:hypothetical protein
MLEKFVIRKKLGTQSEVPLNASRSAAFIRSNGGIMAKEKHDQGIVLDEKSQEQPKDKKRAQSAAKTDDKDDELQPVREKSGF